MGDRGVRDVRGHEWLRHRYWAFAWGILLLSVPLAVVAGRRDDLKGIGAYGLGTLFAALCAKRNALWGLRIHLWGLIPYWAWYSGLADGLPARIDPGPSTFAVLMFFPLAVSISTDGWKIAVGLCGLSCGLVLLRFGFGVHALAGIFLVGTAAMVGLVLRNENTMLAAAQAHLERLVLMDPETELPNRRVLERAIAKLDTKMPAVLFLLSLSRFKTVEDAHGRQVATSVLGILGRRLEVVDGQVVYLGGDRFALLVLDLRPEEIRARAEALRLLIEGTVEVDSHRIELTCRMAAAIWPDCPATDLIRRAERAADHGRRQGLLLSVYESALDPEAERKLEAEIAEAIRNQEFVPHYQPVFTLQQKPRQVVGAEALVRWEHPTKGLLSAAAFVDRAELSGQIVAIDYLNLEQVAVQIEAWSRQGLELWVAANLSARTLEDPSFLDRVKELVARHPGIRGKLVLEITETAAMTDPDRAAGLLSQLRAFGLETALDDFGIGHSSLAYLQKLPATHLKLDRSFVNEIGTGDVAIIEILIQLAKLSNLQMVAEGVGREEQLEWLTSRGCQFAQGFLLARPMPASDIPRLARGSEAVSAPLPV